MGSESYWELTLRKTFTLEEALNDDMKVSDSINKDQKPEKEFIEYIHQVLETERLELGNNLKKMVSDFSREKFNTLLIPEKSEETGEKIYNGDVYTVRGSEASESSRMSM